MFNIGNEQHFERRHERMQRINVARETAFDILSLGTTQVFYVFLF